MIRTLTESHEDVSGRIMGHFVFFFRVFCI